VGLRAVFLDAGNTIVRLDYAVIADRIGAAGHRVTPGEVRHAEERARVRLDAHLGGRSTETRDTFRLYVRYTLEGLSIPADGVTEGLIDELRVAKPPWGLWSTPVPEAPGVLGGLRRRGLALAVVSNSNGTVADILRAVGLAPYLDAILDSAVVGVEKPDPGIFRAAATALGVRPEEAVHVGDLYAVDVVGARAAGCRAILLDPAGAWGPVDCPTAPDLPAAARLIEGMLGG
jgi:HAD superfamily hydrolase (TIGR01509 family)